MDVGLYNMDIFEHIHYFHIYDEFGDIYLKSDNLSQKLFAFSLIATF